MDVAVKSALAQCACAMLVCACGSSTIQNVETLRYTKYTVAQCLAKAYPETPVARDAQVALGGYLEHGALDESAYSAATDLATQTVSTKYENLTGEQLHVAKCLDLLGSPALERLANRYVNNR